MRWLNGLALVVTSFLMMCAPGCDRAPSGSAATRPRQPEAALKPASQWHDAQGTLVVAVADEPRDAALAQATQQARESAAAARERWQVADTDQRERWAVKWAARTIDGAVEHVWVRPATWSAFRIEGVLASRPMSELECAKAAGELVSFPIEELSDWRYDTGRRDGQGRPIIEGDFTAAVLEARFGQP